MGGFRGSLASFSAPQVKEEHHQPALILDDIQPVFIYV